MNVMTLGFGADLSLLKEEWTKSDGVPHFDVCNLSAGQTALDMQSKILHILPTNLDCATGPGDSGGPMLIFNSTSNRYEVIGLTTWGRRVEKRANAMSADARALLETVRQAQSRRYGGELDPEALQGICMRKVCASRVSASRNSDSARSWISAAC